MIKINKKIEYALMALKFFEDSSDHGPKSAREIADTFNIPFDTLSKVLQLLNSNNLINGTKGAKGGYVLNRSLDQIYITSLFEILEEKMISIDCHEGDCQLSDKCNISTPILNLTDILKNFLENITIKDLLSNLKIDDPINLIKSKIQANHEC